MGHLCLEIDETFNEWFSILNADRFAEYHIYHVVSVDIRKAGYITMVGVSDTEPPLLRRGHPRSHVFENMDSKSGRESYIVLSNFTPTIFSGTKGCSRSSLTHELR